MELSQLSYGDPANAGRTRTRTSLSRMEVTPSVTQAGACAPALPLCLVAGPGVDPSCPPL
jgi:hypothetical protein